MDFGIKRKIAIGDKKRTSGKELQRKAESVTTGVSKATARGTGVLNGKKYRDHRFDFRIADGGLRIVDHGTKQDIFRLDLEEPHSAIILGEGELAFYINDNYLVASIPDHIHKRLSQCAEIKSKQIDSTFLPLGSIYLAKQVKDGGCVLYVNDGVFFERNVNGNQRLDISDITEVKIEDAKGDHRLLFSGQLRREYSIDPRYSVSLAYNVYYEKYKNDVKKYNYSHVYKIWGKQLNEYILFLLFGDIIKAYYIIKEHDKRSYGGVK